MIKDTRMYIIISRLKMMSVNVSMKPAIAINSMIRKGFIVLNEFIFFPPFYDYYGCQYYYENYCYP